MIQLKTKIVLMAASLFLVIPNPGKADEEAADAPIASKGKLLFSDDFSRTDLGDWKVIIPGFAVRDGMLVGTQDREDHGSVGRIYLPMSDVVMSFRFRLSGSPRFNVVFDDKDYDGSHAGHICRVAVAQKQIRLGDDREGVMKNDLFEMRRDPEQRAKADALLVGRSANAKFTVKNDCWYPMTIEIKGDRMRVSVNGKGVAVLQSPGIGHPTKQSVHFTVSGKETHFDDVKIWEAREIR